MSVEAMTWALNVPLNGTQKVLLIGLANHATAEFDNARPAISTLARYASCHERNAQKMLRKLEAEGWIAKTGEHLVNGRKDRAVSVYRLCRERGGENDTPSPNGVALASERGGDLSPNGVAITPPEPSLEPSLGTPTASSARAQGKVALPEGFPEELRPHLKAVFRVLRDLAARVGANEVKPVALANVLMARQRKPLVKCAHDYAAWADGKGQDRRDVVAGYRNWLDREANLAAVERLGEQGLPTGPPMNGRTNGTGLGPLKSATYSRGRSWDELTRREQEIAKQNLAMGMRPGDTREACPVQPSGNGLTAENFLDDD